MFCVPASQGEGALFLAAFDKNPTLCFVQRFSIWFLTLMPTLVFLHSPVASAMPAAMDFLREIQIQKVS